MPISGRKNVTVRFSDFSGGVNLSEDSTKIRKNQVQGGTFNAILRKYGALRRPGMLAKSSFDLTTFVKGLHPYVELDKSEHLLAGSNGKLFELSKADGASTELYDLTGDGNFSFADSLGKCWVTNGSEFVKVEGNVAYQVGIDAPTGASAAATNTGGSLPEGTYDIYVGYAREVDGTNVLYSQGQHLGEVVVAAPNNSITISDFAQSTDLQVNKKIVWMTEADGSTVYLYDESTNDAATTFIVDGAEPLNKGVQFGVAAANNDPVPEFEYVLAQDGRIWGTSIEFPNRVYFSLKNTKNPYDLERFFPLNFIDYPYAITGIFSIGINLYINTVVGIIVQPNSDVASRFIHIEKRWRFEYMSTVVDQNAGKIGLTNDGVKYFNGEKFLPYDISEDVKSEIDKIYTSTNGFDPSGVIIRRDIRTEYHLSYNDDNVNDITNNRRLVLNLDKLEYLPEKEVIAPWEIWTNGATQMIVDLSGVVYQTQSHETAPTLYIENKVNSADNGIYLDDETIGDSESFFQIIVCTRTELTAMSARVNWETLRSMAQVASDFIIEVHIRDVEGSLSSDTVGSGKGQSLWNVFLWDDGTWASTAPSLAKEKLPMNLHGYMMFVKFYQTANDPKFNILDIECEGVATQSRFT